MDIVMKSLIVGICAVVVAGVLALSVVSRIEQRCDCHCRPECKCDPCLCGK